MNVKCCAIVVGRGGGGGDGGSTAGQPGQPDSRTARSEVLKRGAPQQPRKQKSNNVTHSPQNNPNKH